MQSKEQHEGPKYLFTENINLPKTVTDVINFTYVINFNDVINVTDIINVNIINKHRTYIYFMSTYIKLYL